ncbi:MAG: dihydrolipoyl dehydrogenase [Candidatus Woesearchaeota archaeon]|nr:MAG: dihydrolipoyl dehydrogenase [Candidatus Woesearchaeota archaeon]
MSQEVFDAIILGAGPSGVACAVRIAQQGGKPLVIERSFVGGVCTNWGCIPTKAMIASAKNLLLVDQAKKLGVSGNVKAPFAKVIAHRDKEILASRNYNVAILKSYGIPLVHGEGKILDKRTVAIKGATFLAKNIVIATGSKPILPTFFEQKKNVLTSKELVSIKKLPKRLVIIGGGVIGVEFASIFNQLGSKVTIIELADRLLCNEDREIGDALAVSFRKQGIQILLNKQVTKLTETSVVVDGKRIPYDKLLVATGRRPLLDELMLERLRINFEQSGILVNDRMQTSLSNIYAIGDATGKSILAHVGIRQALVAANTIVREKDRMTYVVPRAVFSFPEVACVGKTEREVAHAKVGTFSFANNPKARLEGNTEGFVKVIIEKNKIVGFQMIGEGVTELLGEATLIVSAGMSPRQVINTIHPHPTRTEVIKNAVEIAMGESVDVLKP